MNNGNEFQPAWKCIRGWKEQKARSQSSGVPLPQVAPYISLIFMSNGPWTPKQQCCYHVSNSEKCNNNKKMEKNGFPFEDITLES